jgi:iron complex outermembrane recepter protein
LGHIAAPGCGSEFGGACAPEKTSRTSPSQKDQELWPISGAAGAVYDFAKDWQLALNLTYSQRAPTPEELFARGPHDATFQFIIGDPDLDVEINRTADLSLRRTAGRVTGSISGYYTSYSGFIDFTPTGEFEDGLRVFIYTPKNATFYGGEGRVDFHLLPLEITRASEPSDSKSVKNVIMGGEEAKQKNPNDLYLRLQADYVHAEDSSGEPLPRITPRSESNKQQSTLAVCA